MISRKDLSPGDFVKNVRSGSTAIVLPSARNKRLLAPCNKNFVVVLTIARNGAYTSLFYHRLVYWCLANVIRTRRAKK